MPYIHSINQIVQDNKLYYTYYKLYNTCIINYFIQ